MSVAKQRMTLMAVTSHNRRVTNAQNCTPDKQIFGADFLW
jgi:hypothetical protein